jgi:NADPH2:quinone reductase
VPVADVVPRRASLHGFSLPDATAAQSRRAWDTVTGLLAAGRIHPVIDSIYPVEAAAEALRHLIEDRPIGKVVVVGMSRAW